MLWREWMDGRIQYSVVVVVWGRCGPAYGLGGGGFWGDSLRLKLRCGAVRCGTVRRDGPLQWLN